MLFEMDNGSYYRIVNYEGLKKQKNRDKSHWDKYFPTSIDQLLLGTTWLYFYGNFIGLRRGLLISVWNLPRYLDDTWTILLMMILSTMMITNYCKNHIALPLPIVPTLTLCDLQRLPNLVLFGSPLPVSFTQDFSLTTVFFSPFYIVWMLKTMIILKSIWLVRSVILLYWNNPLRILDKNKVVSKEMIFKREDNVRRSLVG